MRSCFGMLLALLLIIAVLGSAGGIWYLSQTADFSRAAEASDAP